MWKSENRCSQADRVDFSFKAGRMAMDNKIRSAMAIYHRFGGVVLGDARTAGLLGRYRDAIEKTQEEMKHCGVVQTCTACAAEEAGGCCFKGVEEWYDPLLLSINLLMGVRLPGARSVPEGCLFVGEKGCRLKARHHFCINYLCSRLKDRLDPQNRTNLMAVAGREICCGIELENAIGKVLGSIPGAGSYLR